MKTAMQELRDILENKSSCHEYGQSDYKDGLKVSLTTAITFIDFFIEKEKEQIIEAHKSGGYEMFTRTSKEYYNQTYNQNK
jgi:hypothetical protein